MKLNVTSSENSESSFVDFVNQEFVESYWNQRPVRLPIPNSRSLCDEEDLIEALRRYSTIPAELKLNNPLAEFVTGVDSTATKSPIASFAISTDDVSIDSYLERAETENRTNEWSIAYFGLHGSSEVVWDAAKIFIKKLSAQLGYRPGGRVDVDCFVGRYSSTPSGVHVDDAHNFGFTFRGGKTMYTWNPKLTEVKWLKSPAYDVYKKDSFPLENDPGFVCYFPHDSLHVGETKHRPSLNVNISFWKESETGKETQKFLFSRITNEKLLRNRILNNGSMELPDYKASDLKLLQESISSGALETYMAMADLLEQTTCGLRVPRPVFAVKPVDFDKTLLLKESATLNWYNSETLEELVIALNGHCLVCPKDQDVLVFLERLTAGNPIVLSDLIGDRASDLAALAQQFNTWGAFDEKF